jgi:hypothetical protein
LNTGPGANAAGQLINPADYEWSVMAGFKNKLSQIIQKDMGLGGAAESDIMSMMNAERSPGKVIRLLTHLSQLKTLWTFPVTEKKRILEYICTELSNHAHNDMFTRLIKIVFGHPAEAGDDNAGIKNFINFMKSSMDSEEYFTVTAGLARAILITLKKYPALIHDVEAKTIAPSLFYERDSVSYATSLNSLISFFGAPSVIPLVIDLLIRHPREPSLFLTNTVFEYAKKLPQDIRVVVFRKLQIFLMTQKNNLSEENIAKLYNGFVLEFGRLFYLSAASSAGCTAAPGGMRALLATATTNKRFQHLEQSMRGTSREPLY